MARNTGPGSQLGAPTGRFVQAKREGGNFRGVRREYEHFGVFWTFGSTILLIAVVLLMLAMA